MHWEEDSSKEGEVEDKVIHKETSAKLSVIPAIKKDTSVTIAPSTPETKNKAREEKQS